MNDKEGISEDLPWDRIRCHGCSKVFDWDPHWGETHYEDRPGARSRVSHAYCSAECETRCSKK